MADNYQYRIKVMIHDWNYDACLHLYITHNGRRININETPDWLYVISIKCEVYTNYHHP